MSYFHVLPSGSSQPIPEKHFHNTNLCYGNNGSNNLQEGSITEFRITSGLSGVFGAELQIHDGTVIESGSTSHSFDLGRFFITGSQASNATYLVEIWAGTTTFGEAEKASEFYYRTGSNIAEVVPSTFGTQVIRCDHKVWTRCKCGTSTSWLDFLLEIHVYPWAIRNE